MSWLTLILMTVLVGLFVLCFRGKKSGGCCSSHNDNQNKPEIQKLSKQVEELEAQSQQLQNELMRLKK